MAKVSPLPANMIPRKGAAVPGDATKASAEHVVVSDAPPPVEPPAAVPAPGHRPTKAKAAPVSTPVEQQPARQAVAAQLVPAVGQLALPTRGDAREADAKRPMTSLTIKVEDIVHKELRKYCFDVGMTVQDACRKAIIHALRNAGVPLEGVSE